MKALLALVVLGLITKETTSRDIRRSKDCLNGVADRNKCCIGVPDAWFAHLRNIENSNSFYQCTNGVPVLMPCPAGLVWSVTGDICDWPLPPTPTPAPEESDESDESSEEATLPQGCYDGTIGVKTCCDGVTDFWVHIPDPKDCTKFYHCDNGKAVHKDCPAGLHWSIVADRCEWPENAQCKGNPITPTKPPVENTDNPTDVPIEATTEEVGQSTDAPVGDTTVDAVNPTNPPEKTTEGPIIEPTDPPAEEATTEQAEKTEAPTQETTVGEVVDPTIPASTDAPIVSPTSPPAEETTEVVVVTDIPIAETTEASVQPTENPILPSGCYDGSIAVEDCCEGITAFWMHLPDPNDCGKFYHCDNGVAVHKDCPAGLHWSIAADRCEWPDNAACEVQSGKTTQLPIEEETISSEEPIIEPTNPPVEATTEEIEQPTDDPIQETTEGVITPTGTPDKPTESPIEVSTQAPVKLPAECYEGIIDVKVCCEGVSAWYVHLPDPEDCTKFYHCDNGVAVHKDCPAGLHWSIAADRCEWPENAECQFEPSKPTSPPVDENTSAPTTEDSNEESTNPEIIEPTDVPVIEPTDDPIVKPTDPPTEELTTDAPIQETTVHAVDPTNPPQESTTAPIIEPTTEQAEQTDAPTQETTIGEIVYPTNPASTDAPIVSPTNPPVEGTTAPIVETTEETVQPTTNPTLPGGCYDGSIDVKVCCEGITAWWIHLPDPKDCGKFYQCDNGVAVHKDCPAELHWSIAADRCEWPDKAGCETQPTKTTEAPIVDTTTGEMTPTISPEVPTDNPIVEPSSTPVDTTTEVTVPTDGPVQETTEGSEVTGNPPVEETNAPTIDPTIPPVEKTTVDVHEPTDTPIEETTEGSGESTNPPDEKTDAPIIDPTIPPVETTTEGVQEPTDGPIEATTKFVEPTKTEPVTTETEPASTVTEPNTTITEPVPTVTEPVPTETESVSTPSEPPTPTQIQTTTERPWISTTPVNNATVPNPDNCEPTPICHQCLTGVFPAEQCCTDVQNWQKIKLANADDCTSYYECINEAAVLRKCPDELYWSSKSDRCEWPKNSECILSTTAASVDTTIRNGDGNGTTSESGGISEDCLYGKVDSGTCCQNVPYWIDVLLQNNNDCHTFYQCVHGVPTVRPCPSNLWWSVTANRCEWLENATCTWEKNN